MITLLLAEDHALVRAGLSLLLSQQHDLQVVAEAADGPEAVRLAPAVQPQVALLDVGLPGLSGLEALERIKAQAPQIRVLMLSGQLQEDSVRRAVWDGASGYLLKDRRLADLLQAIRQVARGALAFEGPGIAEVVALCGGRSGAPVPRHSTLTVRERDVLRLVAAGYSNGAIAAQLGISVKTVDTHRAHVMDKLDLHRRADLITFALREGYLVAS